MNVSVDDHVDCLRAALLAPCPNWSEAGGINRRHREARAATSGLEIVGPDQILTYL